MRARSLDGSAEEAGVRLSMTAAARIDSCSPFCEESAVVVEVASSLHSARSLRLVGKAEENSAQIWKTLLAHSNSWLKF